MKAMKKAAGAAGLTASAAFTKVANPFTKEPCVFKAKESSRLSKQRKLTDNKKFSVPEKTIDGRTTRGKRLRDERALAGADHRRRRRSPSHRKPRSVDSLQPTQSGQERRGRCLTRNEAIVRGFKPPGGVGCHARPAERPVAGAHADDRGDHSGGGSRRREPSEPLKPKTKDLGSSLDVSIDQAVQEQERDKVQQQTRHTKAFKSCLGPDGNVRADCMSKLVKLMEHTSNPKEKIPILQVLKKWAKDPDSSRWTRFMEIKGIALLRQWLTTASHASGGMVEGESDKIVCGCLNVLRRLPLSLERARAEGLIQACSDAGSGRANKFRRLANELIQSWQAADASANGTNGQDSEDSDLESVDDEDESVMVQTDEGATPTDPFSSGSSSPTEPNMSAQQRLEEVLKRWKLKNTKLECLQGLKELGQLVGAPDKKEPAGEPASKTVRVLPMKKAAPQADSNSCSDCEREHTKAKKRASGARTRQQQEEQAKKKREKRREMRFTNTTAQEEVQLVQKNKKTSGQRTTQQQRKARLLQRHFKRVAGGTRRSLDEATEIPQEVLLERRHETVQKRLLEYGVWLPHTSKTLSFCTVYSDVCESLAVPITMAKQIAQMKREAMHTSTPHCDCGCNKEGCMFLGPRSTEH